MTDDTSDIISNASCYNLSSSDLLYAYRGQNRYTYIRKGQKWYYTASTTYNSLPSGVQCLSYSTVSEFNSYPEFYPIYAFIGLELAIIVCLLVKGLVSPMIRWRL